MPQPPIGGDPVIADLLRHAVEREALEPHGSKRVGRRLRVWDIYPEGGGEPWEWADLEPRQWDFDQIPMMYRAALKIAAEVGLKPVSDANWIFCDDDGLWWALPEERELALADHGPMAWRLPLRVRQWGAEAPRDLMDALGGADGPFAWALWVIDLVAGLRDDKALRLKRTAEIDKLTAFPEWLALVTAIEASGDAQALEGLKMLRASLALDGKIVVLGSLAWGFAAGQELGFLQAADSVAQHEANRTKAGGKSDLRAALRDIAVAEHTARGEIRPYVLAKALIAEGDTTERGQRLKLLGMPAEARLGVLLKEEASAAEVYQSTADALRDA